MEHVCKFLTKCVLIFSVATVLIVIYGPEAQTKQQKTKRLEQKIRDLEQKCPSGREQSV